MSKKNAIKICCVAIFCSLVALNAAEGKDTEPLFISLQPTAPVENDRYEQWIHNLLPPIMTAAEHIHHPDNYSTANGILSFTPHSPGDWISVSFVSYRNGNWDIFGLRGYQGLVNTAQAQPFTSEATADLGPKVRPSTGEIAFYSNRSGNYEIFVSGWGGYNLVQLTNDPGYDGQPAWSPDGRRLAFVSNRHGNEELYLYNFDGATLSRLTYSAEPDFAPAFSPSGDRIIWIQGSSETEGVLYQANLDGSDARALTPPLRYLQHPAYSPDGASIAVDYDANNDGWNDIALMEATGANVRVVRYADNLTDLWVGSWATDSDLLVTHVQYIIYAEQRYIQKLGIRTYLPASDTWNYIGDGQLDMAPHAIQIDISVPETHVQAMPRYVKAGESTAVVAVTDPGPAPAAQLELQRRVDDQEDWETVGLYGLESLPGTSWYSFTVDLALGKQISFRSQGIDEAGNVEPWPDGDGDTFTFAYRFGLSGKVIDNRASVIPGALVHSQPALDDQDNTDFYGSFYRYVPASAVTVTVSHPGFGPVPATTFIMTDGQQDIQHLWVLPPADNLVFNSGFEVGFSNWQSDACAQLDGSGFAYSRQTSAKLQVMPTIEPAEVYGYSAGFVGWVDSDVDSSGNLHLIWVYGLGLQHLYHSQKPQGGSWSSPVQIDSDVDGAKWASIDVGSDDSLHITWLKAKTGENAVSYRYRSPQGVWSPVETAIDDVVIWETSDLAAPRILADANGDAHLLYADQYGLHYAYRSSGGVWSAPLSLSNYAPSTMALAPNGLLHVLYSDVLDGGNAVVRYRNRQVDGSWSTPVLVPGTLQGYPRELRASQNGELHMLSSEFEYMTRSASGSWSAVSDISGSDPLSLGVMAVIDNRPHVIAQNDSGIHYRRKFEGGRWSPWIKINSQPGYKLSMTPSAEGMSVFSAYFEHDPSSGNEKTGIHHYAVLPMPPESTCSLTTTVAIPTDMTKPTLSYVQRPLPLQEADYSHAGIQIDNTVIYSTSLAAISEGEWAHQWIDLSAWAGKSVSVTLFVCNDLRYGATNLMLDEVTIGSWRTGSIFSIFPSAFEGGEQVAFTLTGENFAPQAKVLIGDIEATTVVWIDETMLQVEFDHEFTPGIYHLTVINPGGYRSVIPGAVHIGRIVFLPAIQK
jgi:hypothetical protein